MSEQETIVISAKAKKPFSGLSKMLGDLGFNKMSLKGSSLSVEKSAGEDLHGKEHLHYKIVFEKSKISFIYSIPGHLSKRRRLVEVYPVLLNVLKIAEGYYEVDAHSLVGPIMELLSEIDKTVDKEIIDVSSELDEMKQKHNAFFKKYEDLVRSSEQNARILLEAERKIEEQRKRLEQLESLGDETLKEELFKWIKLHAGNVDLEQFCKTHKLTPTRVEEGLNMLIKEGYIKKRSD